MPDQSSSPDRHIAGARRRLTHLAGLAEHTEATERNILAAAEDRLSTVGGNLDKLRGRVNLDDGAADRYQDAVLERGRLETVIARARQALG